MAAVVDGIQHNLGAIAGGAIVIGFIQVCYFFQIVLLNTGVKLTHPSLSCSFSTLSGGKSKSNAAAKKRPRFAHPCSFFVRSDVS